MTGRGEWGERGEEGKRDSHHDVDDVSGDNEREHMTDTFA
jgi:hypothetical protein